MATTKTANPINTLVGGILGGLTSIGTANARATDNRQDTKDNSLAAREITNANVVQKVNLLAGIDGGIDFDPTTNGMRINLDNASMVQTNQLISGVKISTMQNNVLGEVTLKSVIANPDSPGTFTGVAINANGDEVPLTVNGTNDPDDQVLNITQKQIEDQIRGNLLASMAFTKQKPDQLSQVMTTKIPRLSPPSLGGENSRTTETNAKAKAEEVIERGVVYGEKTNAIDLLLKKQLAEDLGEPNLSEEKQNALNANYNAAVRNLKAGSIPEAQLDKLGASYYDGDLSRFTASLNAATGKTDAGETDLPKVGEPELSVSGTPTGVGVYKTFNTFKKDAQTYFEKNNFSKEPEVLVRALTAGQRPGSFGKGNTLLERVLERSKTDPELIPKIEEAIISAQEGARKEQIANYTGLSLFGAGSGLPKRLNIGGNIIWQDTEAINVLVDSILPPEEAAQVVETEVLDAITPDKFRELASDPNFIKALDPEIVAEKAKKIANDNGITSLQGVSGFNAYDSFGIAVAVAGASNTEPGSEGWKTIINGVMNISNDRPFDETSSNRAANMSSRVSRQNSMRTGLRDFAKEVSVFGEGMFELNKVVDSMVDPEGKFVPGSDKLVASTMQKQIGASRQLMASIKDGVYTPGVQSYKEFATKQKELLETRFRYLLNKDKRSTKGILEKIKTLFKYEGDLDAFLSYENLRVIGLSEDGEVVNTTKIKFGDTVEEVTYGQLINKAGRNEATDTFKFLMELKALDEVQRRKSNG